MKKPFIFVLEIEKDIITTSATKLCQHKSNAHIYITSKGNFEGRDAANGTIYHGGTKTGPIFNLYSSNFYSGEWANVSVGNWYYLDGGQYRICDGDHSYMKEN